MSESKRLKCFFVCTHHPDQTAVKGGGIALSKANLEILRNQFDVVIINSLDSFTQSPIGKTIRLFWAIFNYWGGNSPTFTKKFKNLLGNEKPDLVFFDHGILGSLADKAKELVPKVKTIVHFQNVESDYYANIYKNSPLLRFVAVRASGFNEQQAILAADAVITLTPFDRDRLIELYGRKDIGIIPLGLHQQKQETAVDRIDALNLLFCGSFFYPNVQAVKWFVENILDHIPQKLIVIGFGMENLSKELRHPKLIIKGTVPETSPYYQQATAVVSPILSGSGMNTKAIEAISFGKRLLVSSFGFRGFHFPLPTGVVECQDASAFINYLNNMKSSSSEESQILKEYFRNHFSKEARVKKFAVIFKNLGLLL